MSDAHAADRLLTLGSRCGETDSRTRGGVRRPRAVDDPLRRTRRGRGRDSDRQGRRLRLRLLEARRDVRAGDFGGGSSPIQRLRQARSPVRSRDDHRDRPGGEAGQHRRWRVRGRHSRRRARRRLRHGRHARARRGRKRVLLGGRRAAIARCHPGVHRRARRGRRLWRPLQVPAGAERGRPAPPRPPLRARRTERLQDHLLDAAAEPGASVTADVRSAARGFRGAEHRVRSRCAHRLA